MKPLISVIVPIYGIEKYLGICIESILHQTYENLEIILVDDGSPDRCPEICDLYASKDSRITVIHKENGGLVSARKAGILASHGDYIGVVDGDDWIGEGFYNSLFFAVYESDSDMAVAGFTRDLFSKSQMILNAIPSGIYEGQALDWLYGNMLSYGEFHSYGITTYLWNKLFKRDSILQSQLDVDERISIGEDSAVVYPALLKCKKVCITDNCAYHYRQREDSMLKQSKSFEEEAVSLRILYKYLSKVFLSYPERYRLRQQLDDWMLGTFLIRSGGIDCFDDTIPKEFPFSAILRGKRVAVCGAGTFGQQLVRRIVQSREYQIVGWFDDDYWEYRRCCMNVDPLHQISTCDFDYVIIVKLDRVSIDAYRRRLLDQGIGNEIILSINPSADEKRQALHFYLNKQTGGEP